jgi:hypothetical protein
MTAWVRRAWRAWVELWDRREPPTALALVRIGIGLVSVVDLLHTWQLGLVGALWSPLPAGYATHYQSWLPLGASGLWTVALIAAAAILVGAATRVACVAFVVVSVQMSHLAPDSECGVDQLFRIVLIILALSRCNARWSLDAWLARRLGRPPPAEVPAWPRYLIMFQLVWVYFSGGSNKAGDEWGPFGGFRALADALSDPHVARFDPSWLGTAYPLARLATVATMAFELGAPLYLLFYYFAGTRDRPGRLRALCNRLRLRWVWLALGVSFELGIAMTLRLGNFPWGMLAIYPVMLLPDELQRRKTPGPANRASSPS